MTAGALDLTTLAAVRAWAKSTAGNTTDDPLLQSLISSVSRAILQNVNRDSFFGRTVTARLDSFGGTALPLPEYPVTSVSALSVGSGVIPQSTTPLAPAGYSLSAWNGLPPGGVQSVNLFGYGFMRAVGSVGITYRVGYEVIGEPQTIPGTPFKIAPAQPYGPWGADSGVTKGGVAMTPITTGTPTTGQYKVAQDAATGAWTYEFAVADAGQAVLISYSYIPADVFQAATEWVVERYKYRDRIGETSRTIGNQQTAAFDTAGLPKFVETVLNQYRAVGPLF